MLSKSQALTLYSFFVETSIKERVVFVSVVNEGMQAQRQPSIDWQLSRTSVSVEAIKFLGPVSLQRVLSYFFSNAAV
jgi:hypothetical protein